MTDTANQSQQAQKPERLLKLFRYEQLPPALQVISKPFHDLAVHIIGTIPSNPERTLALRALWESKNNAVVACLPDQE
jgi:hypothetical protein